MTEKETTRPAAISVICHPSSENTTADLHGRPAAQHTKLFASSVHEFYGLVPDAYD
jgi:hypothetical protein